MDWRKPLCSGGLLGLLLTALGAELAWAGAWTRQAGDGFTSRTIRYFQTDSGGENARFKELGISVYTEYGVIDPVTIGLEIDQGLRLDIAAKGQQGGRTSAFIRTRLWTGEDGDVFSLQFGGSLPVSGVQSGAIPGGDDAREIKGLMQYGRGFVTDWGNGWAEAALGYAHFTGGRADEIKLDLTTGIRPTENWIGIAQMFGTFSLRDAAFAEPDFDIVKVKLSLGRKIFGNRTLLIGLSRDVYTRGADPGFEVSVSLWSNFTLEGLFIDEDGISGD
ncbi:MAG: hypothetical protein AAF367_20180 [Pseudomonadota bacterium]